MGVVLLLAGAAASAQRIPAGTKVTVRLAEELDSGKTTAGQTWSGTVVNDVTDRSGRVLARAGSPASGVVSDAKDSGRLHAPGILSVRLTRVNNLSVHTDTITRDGQGHTKSNVTKVGGGTAAGALIGGLAGGGKGAGIGALAGAGAGTIGALATGKRQAKIPSEATLTFTTTTRQASE
ncbi:MAG: hypothetical protein ACJ8IR_04435 [Alphaproteobacteria bacterium]